MRRDPGEPEGVRVDGTVDPARTRILSISSATGFGAHEAHRGKTGTEWADDGSVRRPA